MNEGDADELGTGLPQGMSWRAKVVIALLALFAVAVVLTTNRWLSDRFTDTTRNRAELRLALYSGNMITELQRTAVVPLLLARDPELIRALSIGDFSGTSSRLISFQTEIGAASILLLDGEGRTVGATDRNLLGTAHAQDGAFVEALRAKETVFTVTKGETGAHSFTYSRAVQSEGQAIGVIVVAADLMKYERAWAGLQDVVLVTDSEDMVLLSTELRWRGLPLDQALAATNAPTALGRAFQATADWAQRAPDAYFSGEAVMKTEAREIGRASCRERV